MKQEEIQTLERNEIKEAELCWEQPYLPNLITIKEIKERKRKGDKQ